MELKNNIKILVIQKGYKSLRSFAKKHDIKYESLNYLVNGEAKSISYDLIVQLCSSLECDINDLFYINQREVG